MNIYIPMFIAALFKTAKGWKQAICPWVDEKWTNKMCCTHTVEY